MSLNNEKANFKKFLEREFESSKNYKSELKWLMVRGQDSNQV